MTIDMQKVEQSLREKICPSCARFTTQHTCSLPADRPCSLFANLDSVVDIVRDTHSTRIDTYVDVLRHEVCSACHFEDDHGSCPKRDDVDCALNTYYPLIVETIEAELGRQSREQAKLNRSKPQ